ncbi:MAG TPA: hypothetical protein VID75_12450 [Acidimicrobiales bacterium]|jgi:hypothetical protein
MRLFLRRKARSLLSVAGVSGLVLSTLAGTLALSASPAAASGSRRPVCVGTPQSPGVLAGDYRSGVVIQGVCAVNQGLATVHGTLTVTPGSALVAAFALNDKTGKGSSRLSVIGRIHVGAGGTLILGCEPNFFTCVDDPGAATGGTLSSPGLVHGNVIATGALGVIIHDTTINGIVRESGGGGGVTCQTPTTGIWALFGSAPYSDYEDTSIHGDVTVTGLHTCWTGLARDPVSGSLTISHNQLADPDGIEILANQVAGDLTCVGNSYVWDSSEANFGQTGLYPRTAEPNTVLGSRNGQCVLASPATQGGPPGPGPF